MKSKLPFLFACLLCALAFGGCVRSDRPLTAVNEAKPDPRLVAMWRIGENEDKYEDRVVRVTYKEGIGHLELFGDDQKWAPAPQIKEFIATRTAKASYFSLLIYDDDQEIPNASHDTHFVFLRYKISDDGEDLTYWRINSDYFLHAVQTGKIKGQDSNGGVPNNADNIYLKETSENLLRFVDGLPEEAFKEPVKCLKMDIRVR